MFSLLNKVREIFVLQRDFLSSHKCCRCMVREEEERTRGRHVRKDSIGKGEWASFCNTSGAFSGK